MEYSTNPKDITHKPLLSNLNRPNLHKIKLQVLKNALNFNSKSKNIENRFVKPCFNKMRYKSNKRLEEIKVKKVLCEGFNFVKAEIKRRDKTAK